MSLNTQPDDIILHMMSFLDIQNILRLALCAKRFSALAKNENLWKLKMLLDLQQLPANGITPYDQYKEFQRCMTLTSQLHQLRDLTFLNLQKTPHAQNPILSDKSFKTSLGLIIMWNFHEISDENTVEACELSALKIPQELQIGIIDSLKKAFTDVSPNVWKIRELCTAKEELRMENEKLARPNITDDELAEIQITIAQLNAIIAWKTNHG